MVATDPGKVRTTVAHITGEEDLDMVGERVVGTCLDDDSTRYMVASVEKS